MNVAFGLGFTFALGRSQNQGATSGRYYRTHSISGTQLWLVRELPHKTNQRSGHSWWRT